MKAILRTMVATVMVLATLILAILFIFPTRDTKEESRAAYRGLQKSVFALAYDDSELVGAAGVVLDENDYKLMQQRNPDTGQHYTETEVRRLKLLRQKFPDNQLIPRFRTPEELERLAERNARLARIEQAFSRKRGTPEEINEYFNAKQSALRDWRQLLEFVVHDENWSPAIRDKYARMLGETKRIEKRIEGYRGRTLALNSK